jgi:hypothetical protein
MAKGGDHDIMRALETHLKAIPWKFAIEFGVVTGLHLNCKDICNRALNWFMLFHYHPIIHVGTFEQGNYTKSKGCNVSLKYNGLPTLC